MSALKNFLRSNRFTARPLELYFLHKFFLKPSGWMESKLKRMPVDGSGKPIPWLTYPAIHFLQGRLTKEHRIFEFGSGNSTLWLAERSKQVVSIEYDAAYYDLLAPKLKNFPHIEYLQAQPGLDYYQQLSKRTEKFDVVIIDGRERVLCALHCLEALSEQGVVVFDNSERERYREGLDFLAEKGFKRIDFRGLPPGAVRQSQTTVFYRNNNCLGI